MTTRTLKELIAEAKRRSDPTPGLKFRFASDDDLCVLFGVSQADLDEYRAEVRGTCTVTSIDRVAGAITIAVKP